jgi:hypothetical protein
MDSGQILEHVGDYCNNIIHVHASIRFAQCRGIEMNPYFSAASSLCGPISYSPDRVDFALYWIEETLKGIPQLNNNHFVH